VSFTILAIDDDHAERTILKSLFAHWGFGIEIATNGKDGLEKAASVKPDLIITDVMMPDMDGYSMLMSLKANADLAGIPVIVLSGQTGERYETISEGFGALYHMNKPVDPPELLAKVKEILKVED
jgi:DNA-binding response OmpR family regulator